MDAQGESEALGLAISGATADAWGGSEEVSVMPILDYPIHSEQTPARFVPPPACAPPATQVVLKMTPTGTRRYSSGSRSKVSNRPALTSLFSNGRAVSMADALKALAENGIIGGLDTPQLVARPAPGAVPQPTATVASGYASVATTGQRVSDSDASGEPGRIAAWQHATGSDAGCASVCGEGHDGPRTVATLGSPAPACTLQARPFLHSPVKSTGRTPTRRPLLADLSDCERAHGVRDSVDSAPVMAVPPPPVPEAANTRRRPPQIGSFEAPLGASWTGPPPQIGSFEAPLGASMTGPPPQIGSFEAPLGASMTTSVPAEARRKTTASIYSSIAKFLDSA